MTDPDRLERLLVLAPTGRDGELAARVLRGAGLEVERCADVADLCARASEGAAAVLLTEEVLTPAALAALAAVVTAQEPWSDLPFVVFAGAGRVEPGPEEPLAALGDVTLVDRPLRRRTLLSVARAALRSRRRQYAARDVLVELRRAIRQRDEFLALLGHELRNPLAAISMAGELIARAGGSERPVEIVRRQSRLLTRIVDDLLDVSRVTSGKIVLRPAPLDLRALAARVVEAHAAEFVSAAVAVAFSGGDEPVFTVGDEARLEQILSNLVSNAAKYTPAGGHVRVSAAAEGEEAVLRVADDGIGITAEHLGRIFEPFVQVAASLDRSRGGMGLGLTLVRGLVELHGGTIQARSDGPGKGSEFTVRLRRVAREDVPRNGAARTRAAARPRDVLVVEDQDDVRATFVEALVQLGHRVRSARDGQAGIALARAVVPEVAFLDIGLPGMDGYELARRLRAELGGDPVMVALTGYGLAEDRARSLDAGFDVHLTKPVDLERVEEILRDPRRRPVT